MNFDAAERISKPEVRQLLHEVWKVRNDFVSLSILIKRRCKSSLSFQLMSLIRSGRC